MTAPCWFCKDGDHSNCVRRDPQGKLISDSEDDCECQVCYGLEEEKPKEIRTAYEAAQIVGGLSKVTKLPCLTYNLPAEACITGQKLVCVEGSVCNGCYALRGWYPKRGSSWKRLEAIKDPRWVEAMVYLIKFHNQAYFRWHDSGDLQGTWHLRKIVEVAEQTPDTQYWLPTQEYEIVKKLRLGYGIVFPNNLTVRLSAHKLEGPAPIQLAKQLGVQVSLVSETAYTCQAHTKTSPLKNGKGEWKGHCGSCRECWNPDTFSITYKLHLSKNKLTPGQSLARVAI